MKNCKKKKTEVRKDQKQKKVTKAIKIKSLQKMKYIAQNLIIM